MKFFKLAVVSLALFVSTGSAFAAKIGSGNFTGASSHKTSGTVSVSSSGGKIIIKLGKSFSLDGAPDPYISLGHGSKPVSGGILQILKSNNGAQTYTASAKSIDLQNVNSVIVWCKKYSVPLGVAKIR